VLWAASLHAASGPCGPISRYNGYKVLRVDIKDPIGFISPWSPVAASLKKSLKLRAGELFSADALQRDSDFLNKILTARPASGGEKFKVSFTSADIRSCDPETRTLRVVYPFFSTSVTSLIPPSIEEQTKEAQSPGTTGAARAADRSFEAAPVAGYNQTRGLFGGVRFSGRARTFTFQGESEDSADSHNGHLELGSHLARNSKLWDHADWAAGFVWQDMPAAARRFEENRLTLRASAATRELTRQRVIFRYGTALEAGHQQSNGSGAAPNSGYGSWKGYAGITGRPGNGAFAASYGMQLGSLRTSGLPVFRKHLLDLAYNHSFTIGAPPLLGDRQDFRGPLNAGVHRTLNVETRLTGGVIQNATGAPVAERFLGGNEVRPFVQDGSWLIPADAWIRSIPENRLGSLQGAPWGGTRFYAANATVSFTLWGKPLLPMDLATAGGGFPEVLNPGFQTAAASLANTYKTHDPEFIRLTAEVPARANELSRTLASLSSLLRDLPADGASVPGRSNLLVRIRRNINDARGAAVLTASAPDPQVIERLTSQVLPALAGQMEDLAVSLRTAGQADVASELDSLRNDIRRLELDIDAAHSLPANKYQNRAWAKLAPGHRALDVFLHRLNVYSIAPVVLFDVARVWPVGQAVHYGVGPGVRLSLINVNFTLGYAVNARRTAGEQAGAIYLKLDVVSLF
jgi:hypothetical protein